MSQKTFLSRVRSAFLAGLGLLAPLVVTWIVFAWLIERVGGGFRSTFFFFLPDIAGDNEVLDLALDGLAILIVLLLVTALGYLSRYVVSHYFVRRAERLIANIPVVRVVYRNVKHIIHTVSLEPRRLVEHVVLIEFPRRGAFAIGFLTNRARGEVQARTATEVFTVFVPTTPNPTSGFLVFVPRDQVTVLDMTVGDALKLIISGGAVSPAWPAAIPPSRQPMVAPGEPPRH